MTKNALQTVLNLVKSGALKTMAATPVGQLATKIGQASSFLRAPSMEDLGNAYNQSVGRASSFVQKYPSPASYVAQRMPQIPQLQTQQFRQYIPEIKMPTVQYSPIDTFRQNIQKAYEPFKPLVEPYRQDFGEAYKSQLKAIPSIAISSGAPGLRIPGMAKMASDENKEMLQLQQKNLQARLVQGSRLTPEERDRYINLSTRLIMGATTSPIAIRGGGLGIQSTRAYATYLRGLKKYNISETAIPEDVGRAFENAITKAEGNISAMRTVLRDFKILNRIKPSDVLQDVQQAVEWYKNLLPKAILPSPQPTGGSMIKVGKQTPVTANEKVFTKIADVVRQNFGTEYHEPFEGPEIRAILKKAGLTSIPEGTTEGHIGDLEFMLSYQKKNLEAALPMPPTLVVNFFPKKLQTQSVAPQVVQPPSVQPSTLVPQVPRQPIVTQPIQVPKTQQQQTQKIVIGKGEDEQPIFTLQTVNASGKIITKQNFSTRAEAESEMDLSPVAHVPKTVTPTQPQPPSSGGEIWKSPKYKSTGDIEFDTYVKDVYKNFQSEKQSLLKDLQSADKDIVDIKLGGSYGKGTPRPDSDIDLTIIYKGKKDLEEIADQFRPLSTKNGLLDVVVEKAKVSSGGEIGGVPVPSPAADELPSPALLDHFRKAAREVNVDELAKLNGMSIAEQNRYVEQLSQNQSTAVTTEAQKPLPEAPAVTPDISVPVTQVPTSSTAPSGEIPLGAQGPRPGEKKFKFLQSLLESVTVTSEMKQKIDDEIYKFYKQKGNEQTFAEARSLLESDREGVVAEIMSGKPLNDTLNAAGQLLFNQLQYEKNFGLAIDIAKSLVENGPHAGRAVQIYATIDKLSPEGMLYYVEKVINEAQEKMNPVDKALGFAGRHIEEAPKVAKQMTEELNKINASVADQIAKEVTQRSRAMKKQKIGEGVKGELLPEEQLSKRVESYVKSLEAKKKENDPIRNMVNTLYKVAKEILPTKTSLPQDPLLFIKEAIQKREEYKDVWNEARDLVAKKFEGDESSLELLDSYFEHVLVRPFATSQMKQAVAGAIKGTETDIGKVVRDWYVEKQEEYGKTLAKSLSERAGLTDEDASMLEDYAVKRFRELTQKRKEQILASLVKKYPKLQQKKFLQKLYELSNLGAFSDKRYYDLIAERLKIPNLTEKEAKNIFDLSQKIQKTEVGSPEREELLVKITDVMAEKIPYGTLDWLESYRINNILSGPGTQYRNAWTALTSALFYVPANLTVQSIMDFVRSFVTQTPREIKFNTALYYFSVLKNIIPGGQAAWKSLVGKTLSENTDLQGLQFRRFRKKFPIFSIPTSVMEAVDQLGQVNISRAISETLQAGGMEKEASDTQSLQIAKDFLYRLPLDVTNASEQGYLLTTVDKTTSAILNFRRAAFLSRFFIPFVIVPSQVFKKSIEFSPAGLFTRFGASKERARSHIANWAIGMAISAWVLQKALKGETNWETPKDEKQRLLMQKGGADIPQYSVKVLGKYWVPIWYFGPALLSAAYPMAFKYYWTDSPTTKLDPDYIKAMKSVAATAVLFTKQTYMKGVGDMLSFINGSPDVNMEQVLLTNPLTSYSPAVGFTRWLSTIVDPTFRRTQSFWDGILKSYPWASTQVEPYRTITGEEAKRSPYGIFLPWDIGTENPEARYLFRERQIQVQDNKVISDMTKQIGVPEYIKSDSPQEIEYISTHPEAAFASTIRSLAKKLQGLNSQEISLYGEKDITAEEKNQMYDAIVEQKKVIKDQLNYVWQEIQSIKGKPTKRNVFDEVQAAEYQKDTEVMAKSLEAQQQKLFKESETALQKIKALRDVSEKYKRLWPIFDMGVTRNSLDSAYTLSKRLGVDPQKAEYDYWTSVPVRERREKIDEMILNKTNAEAFNILIPLRENSEGTGKPMLSEELISNLVEDNIISKYQGKVLRAIKTSRITGQLISTASGDDASRRLKELKQISTLIEQRGAAYQKALRIRSPRVKIPKITFPKAPKMPRISARSLNVTPSRFVLRIPKRTSIKTSGRMQSLLRVRK